MGHFDKLEASKAAVGNLYSLYGNGTSAKTGNFTAEAGFIYAVTKLDGCAITLPAPSEGARIKILLGAVTSNSHTITTDASTTLYSGAVLSVDAADATAAQNIVFAPDGSDDRIITLNGSTQGICAQIELVGVSDSEWQVSGQIFASGTVITPFS